MEITKSDYFHNVIPALQNEIMAVVNRLNPSDSMGVAKQVDAALRESLCLFAHSVVLGNVVAIRDHSGNVLIEIDAAEYGSSCCFAPLIAETDICSKCKEHTGLVAAE